MASNNLHIVLFPFMAKGHTIPLLHLTNLIHNHRPAATFTVFTTPANEPFITASLSSLIPNIVTIVSLNLSTFHDDIPLGVQSTDQLPSMSLFNSFANSTINLQPHFETALENLHKGHNPVSVIISDGFFYWTQQSASKFGIPRLVFYGFNMYNMVISRVLSQNGLFSLLESDDCDPSSSIQVPNFPWIQVTKDDVDSPLNGRDNMEFLNKCRSATSMSFGLVVNSFYELEQPFVDYFNSNFSPKPWCVGPLCLVEESNLKKSEKDDYLTWLDTKHNEGKAVLYVAFGTQVEISDQQLKEIALGLEKSRVNFLWVLRIKPNQEENIMGGFEERVKNRGLVVRSWVDQKKILEHESVQGFLSHCGWNSAIESICASVPILGWPMIAEQHLNAKMVAEEIGMGLRVEYCDDGLQRRFVKWESLSKMVKELMEGEMGMKVRKKVKEVSEIAKKSVEEGGSSWCNLEKLLNELEMRQTKMYVKDNA